MAEQRQGPGAGEARPDGVTTLDAERTFWDKILILHGLRFRFDSTGQLRNDGNRESRHYYDVHRFFESGIGQRAAADRALALDCARHARMFFNTKYSNLMSATPGTYAIAPTPEMVAVLRRDYQAMAPMIFENPPPTFADVMASIEDVETWINTQPQ